MMISIVIPVYNQLHYTKLCVDSITRYTEMPFELIIIDNGSADGTSEYLKGLNARIITNPGNLGCAKSWNQGVNVSTGDVIGILNNDIVVTSGWAERLLSFMHETNAGIVSPAAREGLLDYSLDEYAAEFAKSCARASRRFDIYSACMLIHRRVFDKIGLFDEAFSYGGFEDTDFLWRAREKGFSIGITGSALIHHFGMVTQNSIKEGETREYPKFNQDYFEAKWKRTARGNWLERRWSDIRMAWVRNYEKIRYRHTLVEKI